MNKVVLKEFQKKYIIVDIVFYIIFVVLGFTLLNFAEMGLTNPIKYGACIFYTLAFFSILAYFVNRRKDDYEFLLFGFINVVTATFILIYTAYPDSGFILSDAVLLYSIANVLNKGYSCNRLLSKKDFNFFPKVSVTVLLLFLGVFVVASLYNKVEVGVLILGYYFIIFGLLSLLEPFNSILFENKTISNYLLNLLHYNETETKVEDVKEEVKEEVPVKKVAKKTTKKTTKKASTKKTTKKAPVKKATTKKKTVKKTTKK